MTDPEIQESDGGIADYPDEFPRSLSEPEEEDDAQYEAALEKEWEKYD